MAFFYSEKFDTWFQFDDDIIKSVGSFADVRKKCLAGRQRPTTVFYERSDVIINVLSSSIIGKGSSLKKGKKQEPYFSE